MNNWFFSGQVTLNYPQTTRYIQTLNHSGVAPEVLWMLPERKKGQHFTWVNKCEYAIYLLPQSIFYQLCDLIKRVLQLDNMIFITDFIRSRCGLYHLSTSVLSESFSSCSCSKLICISKSRTFFKFNPHSLHLWSLIFTTRTFFLTWPSIIESMSFSSQDFEAWISLTILFLSDNDSVFWLQVAPVLCTVLYSTVYWHVMMGRWLSPATGWEVESGRWQTSGAYCLNLDRI